MKAKMGTTISVIRTTMRTDKKMGMRLRTRMQADGADAGNCDDNDNCVDRDCEDDDYSERLTTYNWGR